MSVQWHDLLGIPYELYGRDVEVGIDCWVLCELVWKRLGVKDPPTLEGVQYGDNQTPEEQLAVVEHWMAQFRDRFVSVVEGPEIPRSLRLREGDLVWSSISRARSGDHASVVVEPDERMVLTAAVRRGVYAEPLWAVQRKLGLYRLKELA